MTSTTGQEQQGTLELQQESKDSGPVECLGLSFENEQKRREHFLTLLKEKLQDPEFRKTPDFPQSSDQAILRMSDPPYYTACPNPLSADSEKVTRRFASLTVTSRSLKTLPDSWSDLALACLIHVGMQAQPREAVAADAR